MEVSVHEGELTPDALASLGVTAVVCTDTPRAKLIELNECASKLHASEIQTTGQGKCIRTNWTSEASTSVAIDDYSHNCACPFRDGENAEKLNIQTILRDPKRE